MRRVQIGGWYAGCTFADFDGNLIISAFRDLSLVQCTFANNTLFPLDLGAAVIQADASMSVSYTHLTLPTTPSV